MSLPFEIAPDCASKNCTNLLTSRSEFKRGYCLPCQEDAQEYCWKCNGTGIGYSIDERCSECRGRGALKRGDEDE